MIVQIKTLHKFEHFLNEGCPRFWLEVAMPCHPTHLQVVSCLPEPPLVWRYLRVYTICDCVQMHSLRSIMELQRSEVGRA